MQVQRTACSLGSWCINRIYAYVEHTGALIVLCRLRSCCFVLWMKENICLLHSIRLRTGMGFFSFFFFRFSLSSFPSSFVHVTDPNVLIAVYVTDPNVLIAVHVTDPNVLIAVHVTDPNVLIAVHVTDPNVLIAVYYVTDTKVEPGVECAQRQRPLLLHLRKHLPGKRESQTV